MDKKKLYLVKHHTTKTKFTWTYIIVSKSFVNLQYTMNIINKLYYT